MAQKFRKIDPRIWRDEKFAALKPEEKLIALYCLTAQSNRCGIFVFSPAMAAEELGMSQGTFRERFEGVVCALRWEWDATLRVLYLPTWWRYNQPENANVLIGNLGDLAELPNTPLIARFLTNFEHLKPTYRIQVGKKWEELEIQALFAKAPRASSVSTGNVSAPGNGSHKEPLGNVPPNVGGNVDGGVLAQEQKQKQEQEQEQDTLPGAGHRGDAGRTQAPPTADALPPKVKPVKKAKPAPEPNLAHKACVARFCDSWATKYGAKYPFNGGKDGAAVKWMLEQAGSEERFSEIVARYFADDDEFVTGHKHGLGLLRSQFQRWLADAPPRAPAPRSRGPSLFIDDFNAAAEEFLNRNTDAA